MSHDYLRVRVSFEAVPHAWLRLVLGISDTRSVMEHSLHRTIANRIENAITEAGYKSQDEFARVIGMQRTSLRRVLSGKYDTKVSTLAKIAEGLEMSLEQLLTFSDHAVAVPRKKGRPTSQNILVQILIPQDAPIPAWLQTACEEGSKSLTSDIKQSAKSLRSLTKSDIDTKSSKS